MQAIELLNKLGYNTVSEDFYNYISTWDSWYNGKVQDFHSYSVYNGENAVQKEKYSLGMAKTSCEDWANYLFNKDTKINVMNDSADAWIEDFFKRIHFDENINQCIERSFATGTSAVSILEDENGDVALDFIKDSKMIIPISWSNGEIIDCCLASYKNMAGRKTLFLNIHEKDGQQWRISNRFFEVDSNGEIGNELFYDDVATEYYSDVKRYFVYKPAVLNNIGYNNPMGISIFAGAIDALKGIDTVYDSYINEFVLGKKRIMVSADAVKVSMKNGQTIPVFDTNDTTFYMLPNDSQDGVPLIKEIDMKLRINEHKEGIADMLNMLSVKIGMGTKHYSFVGGAITATEIKSSRDTLYQSMIKHETPLEDMLVNMCKSILWIAGFGDQDVNIEFSDSVIADRDSELVSLLQLLNNGVIGRAEVRSWWSGADIATAKKMIAELDAEQPQQPNNIYDYPVQ